MPHVTSNVMTCDDPLDPLFEDERFDGTEGLFSSLVLFGSPIEPLAKSQAIHLSSSIGLERTGYEDRVS